jgi:hypothetical protein
MNRLDRVRERARDYYKRHVEQYTAYQRKHRNERKLHPRRPDWKHTAPRTKAEIRAYFAAAANLDIPYRNTYSLENRTKLDKLKQRIC